jgi:hypothetical protein
MKFTMTPHQERVPYTFPMKEEERAIFWKELKEMLVLRHIRRVSEFDDQALFFVRPFLASTGGKKRLVFDLAPLNRFLTYPSFRQEGVKEALEAVSPGDWFVKIDIRKAFWHIPVGRNFRKYVRFRVGEEEYEVTSMPLGLGSAPFICHALMSRVAATLREENLRLSFFVDDWLAIGSSKEEAELTAQKIIWRLVGLGFFLNDAKTMREARQKVEFLGLTFDADSALISVPSKKLKDLASTAKKMMEKGATTARRAQSLLGSLAFFSLVHPRASAHKTAIERWKNDLLKEKGWDEPETISRNMMKELKWWSVVRRGIASSPMSKGRVDVMVQTDAGPLGWAATWSRSGETWDELAGAFGRRDVQRSSNVRELKALKNVLKMRARSWRGTHLEWTTDSAVAARYVRKIHGRFDHLVKLARQVNELLWRSKILLSIKLVKGTEIPEVDLLSRLRDRADWTIQDQCWARIVARWGIPQLDLFASRFSTRAVNYVSKVPDSNALWTDAFASSWGDWSLVYAFPPPKLALKTVKKIITDGVREAILILPCAVGAWTHFLERITLDVISIPWGAVRDTTGRNVVIPLQAYRVSGLLYSLH